MGSDTPRYTESEMLTFLARVTPKGVLKNDVSPHIFLGCHLTFFIINSCKEYINNFWLTVHNDILT